MQLRDHPVPREDESDIAAVELAALHQERAVDPLRWFGILLMPYTSSCKG